MKLLRINKIENHTQYDIEVKDTHCFFANGILVHNSNAGITFTSDGEMWAQSREHIITPENDNAGFAMWVHKNREVLKELVSSISFNGYDYVTIFGEWCGQGIQKGVAIAQLPKMFVIFDIKRSYEDESKGINVYSPESEITSLRSVENQIYNIYDFRTFTITIDFNDPASPQEQLNQLVADVEAECPVGKAFGVSGVGEGIVWSFLDENGNKYRFKTKGEKHSSSKQKTVANIDTEKLNSVSEFVEYAVTESRLNQSIEKTYGIGKDLDIAKMGDFIRWVVGDIMKEELDTLAESGLSAKDVNGAISKKCRDWLLNKINSTF